MTAYYGAAHRSILQLINLPFIPINCADDRLSGDRSHHDRVRYQTLETS